MEKIRITVSITIDAPIDRVWECWTLSEHITNWNFASKDWSCPRAVNDLRPEGAFNWRMEAKDGSMGFDFTGTYVHVTTNELITYKMSDGRMVEIQFSIDDQGVNLSETFDVEGTNADELQRQGWQSILGNFKNYVESKVQ